MCIMVGGHCSSSVYYYCLMVDIPHVTGLSLLNVLRLPLSILPIALSAYKEACKSHERVKNYFDSPEAKNLLLSNTTDDTLVDIKNATFSWSECADETHSAITQSLVDEKVGAVLQNVNLKIRKGEFVALVGEVGSGKTSLINALMGQMTLLSGEQTLSAKTAYVSQESWIQNITLQENVLFSSPMDHERYVEVLDASQLSQDLLTLPNADSTEIGERGINLSGGQKARVNIARALYASDIDLYVFDDPIAAVDVHVGKELFQHAFKEMLHDKARVLSLSSNYQFLTHFDKIVVVLNGTITTCESYTELKERFPQFASSDGEESFRQEEIKRMDFVEGVKDSITESNEEVRVVVRTNDEDLEVINLQEEISLTTGGNGIEMTSKSASRLSPQRKTQRGHSIYLQKRDSILLKQQSGKVLTTTEDKESGAVTLSTYMDYFAFATSHAKNPKLAGAFTLLIMFVLFLIAQVARVYSDLWPGLWAADQERDKSKTEDDTWFMWYIILLAITIIFAYGRAFHLILSCVWANISLHESLVGKVFAAPVNTYFDITPLGRILNRFSKDLDMLDSMLPDFFLQNVQNIFHIVAVLIMCALSSAFFAILVPFLCLIFYYIYSHFRKTSRELKRFDGVTRSPVYSSFGEMLNGISTIRAYRRQSFFFDQFCDLADDNFRHFFCFFQASRWLALRLDLVSNVVILFVSLIAVLIVDYGGSVNENMLGLALVYALQLMGMLQWTVRVTIETENNMTAAERLLTFNNISSEAARVLPSDPSGESWPTKGHVIIKNLSMRYRPGLETVISGVNLDIPGGCKVGVCGRTGILHYSIFSVIAFEWLIFFFF
jgi:ABC-type multidrug transport system fused ATPase/permease subunit